MRSKTAVEQMEDEQGRDMRTKFIPWTHFPLAVATQLIAP